MKRPYKETVDRYCTVMMAMYNKGTFNPVGLCREFGVTTSLNAELRRLKYVAKLSPGKWTWIGPLPNKIVAQTVRNRIRASIVAGNQKEGTEETAPLFVVKQDASAVQVSTKDRSRLYYLAGKYGIASNMIEQFVKDIEEL